MSIFNLSKKPASERMREERLKAGLSISSPVPAPKEGSIINRAGVTVGSGNTYPRSGADKNLINYSDYTKVPMGQQKPTAITSPPPSPVAKEATEAKQPAEVKAAQAPAPRIKESQKATPADQAEYQRQLGGGTAPPPVSSSTSEKQNADDNAAREAYAASPNSIANQSEARMKAQNDAANKAPVLTPAQHLNAIQSGNTTWSLPRETQERLAAEAVKQSESKMKNDTDLDRNKKDLEASKYNADSGVTGHQLGLQGTKYTADKNLEGQRISSETEMSKAKLSNSLNDREFALKERAQATNEKATENEGKKAYQLGMGNINKLRANLQVAKEKFASGTGTQSEVTAAEEAADDADIQHKAQWGVDNTKEIEARAKREESAKKVTNINNLMNGMLGRNKAGGGLFSRSNSSRTDVSNEFRKKGWNRDPEIEEAIAKWEKAQ